MVSIAAYAWFLSRFAHYFCRGYAWFLSLVRLAASTRTASHNDERAANLPDLPITAPNQAMALADWTRHAGGDRQVAVNSDR